MANTWGVDYALLDKNDWLIGEIYSYRDERTLCHGVFRPRREFDDAVFRKEVQSAFGNVRTPDRKHRYGYFFRKRVFCERFEFNSARGSAAVGNAFGIYAVAVNI